MKAYPEASIDEGHLAFCLEDNKRYEFRAANPVDATTGRWREFKPGMTTVPLATTTVAGGIKIGYTATNKNYPVALDANGKAYVNVPWANTTYSKATSAADGLMSAADKAKLDGLSIATVAEVEALLV